MFTPTATFSGFSVKDLNSAKDFYVGLLGLEVADETMGLGLKLPHDAQLFIYPKEDHQPATFTVLNFVVANIDEAVDALTEKGIRFERYEGMPAPQDEKGILRGLAVKQGPDIAWFKDPSGNILAVLQDK